MLEGSAVHSGRRICVKEEEAKLFVASQWQLVWWKFRRHKLALFASFVVVFIYAIALFAEFFEPFPAGPVRGQLHLRPAAAPAFHRQQRRSPSSACMSPATRLRSILSHCAAPSSSDPEQKYAVTFLAQGFPYKLLGIIPTNRHLIGPVNASDPMYLIGRRQLRPRSAQPHLLRYAHLALHRPGRCVPQPGPRHYPGRHLRLLWRHGRQRHPACHRVHRSLPTIPLWMGLAAALPALAADYSLLRHHDHPLAARLDTLARVVRGRFLSLREEDFVLARYSAGAEPTA